MKWASRAALVLGAVVLALGMAEIVLRVLPEDTGYFVRVPHTTWTITAAPDVFPGVYGDSHYTINSVGIRGREFGADPAEYRILAVGGSTTECANLDDTETWTRLLESSLGRTADGRSVWVGGVARSGLTTRDNALHIKYLLRQFPRIDAVVALVGVNDFQAALAQGGTYVEPGPITNPREEQGRLSRAFTIVPSSATAATLPWHKTTRLWRLARNARLAFNARRQFTLNALSPEGWKDWRTVRQQTAARVNTLPRLDRALAEYRRNLNAMADYAEQGHARLVLVTHPSLWGENLSPHVDSLLWFGWIGPDRRAPEAYFTPAAEARGMRAFNGVLLEVCRARGVECVDADRALSRDGTAFFDDVHFNERGARLLAVELAGWFRGRAPFGNGLTSGPDSPTINRSRPQPSPLRRR